MFRVRPDSVECDTIAEVRLLQNGHSNGHTEHAPVKRKYGTGQATKSAWRTTRKVAKKLGRTDLKTVHAEIKSGDLDPDKILKRKPVKA